MKSRLVNTADSVERQNEKLLKITQVLMNRVEQVTNDDGAAYEQFQRAVMLEDQVRTRTKELEDALNLLNESNYQLSLAMREAEASRNTLTEAIETVREGFGLFDAEDRLTLCNSRFGMFMPDIQSYLKPGLSFFEYIDHASQSRFIDLPQGVSAAEWAKRRRNRHREEHVVFNVAITGDRWVQVSEHRTAAGETVILQTDVTDIMRIERRERSRILDNQSRLIAATLDHLEQAVAVFDLNNALIGWNNRVSELLGLPLTSLRIGAHADTLLDHLRMVSDDADIVSTLAAWIEGANGRPPVFLELTRTPGVVLKVNARAMPDRGFVVSFTDITAEREAAAELMRAKETLERRVVERTLELEDALSAAERANASKSRFVAAASHDLLQPLSAAKLFVSSMPVSADDEQGERVLAKTKSALNSVEDMIGALLAISKLETVNETFDVRPVSLGDLLARLDTEFQPMAAAKGVALKVLPSSAWVSSDPTYLRRIIQNLIGNAIRYTETGRVLVGARQRGPMIRIDVFDTGPGIPEEAQSDIFEEFHRLENAKSSSDGLGLGLTIVDRACALLGHPLSVRSTVGRGSCFSVGAPRIRDVPQRAGRTPESGSVQRSETGALVLVIDDDAEVRGALEYALGELGHYVMEAESVADGLALIVEIEAEPDFLFLDFQLGRDTTALEHLDEIGAALPGTPICILTANRSPEIVAMCEERNLSLLHKPVGAEALDKVIRSASA